jgi:hypothetical protein
MMGLRDKTQASLEISIFTTNTSTSAAAPSSTAAFPSTSSSFSPSEAEESLLDMILVTFVYVETTRAEREKATMEVIGETGQAVGGTGL